MPCPATAYFNPRSPHGERRDIITAGRDDACDFNPRSPHGERRLYGSHARRLHHFNPRSPHGERPSALFGYEIEAKFQSTLPARGATRRVLLHRPARRFQSTLPARGATTSSHAPPLKRTTFQSTLPARGATPRTTALVFLLRISIHAPRTGSDHRRTAHGLVQPQYFNPRSPHGERHAQKSFAALQTHISIHAPRTGSDLAMAKDKNI